MEIAVVPREVGPVGSDHSGTVLQGRRLGSLGLTTPPYLQKRQEQSIYHR